MSCNNTIPLRTLADRVAAILAANYIDKDDPRITNGVFTSPSIRGEFLLDPAAKDVFCDLVQSCVTSAPFGKTWLTKPLYPGAVLVSYEDNGETKYRWTTEDELVPNKMLIPKPAIESAVAVSHIVDGKTSITWEPLQDVVGQAANDETIMLSSIIPGTPPRSLKDKNRERVSVKDFGAKGDGDQTLIEVTPYKAGRDRISTITQQTADGIAFNEAIRYLKSVGGGALYVPTGEYRIYGYLESLDFPLVLYGDGESSRLVNCDNSPTDKNGYGILVVQPLAEEEISLMNFMLDGVADIRTKPTGEHQLYPLVVYGAPRLRVYGVTSVNSPIDCLNVNLDNRVIVNNFDCFAKFVNCYFNNSYRNTVTTGRGEGIEFVNCTVSRGGFVHGGTQPRYCVDIEPNISSYLVKTKWVNCTFSHGVNVLVGGVWSDSTFSNCLFDGSYVADANKDAGRDKFPWLFQLTAGQWEVDNCKFLGRSDAMRNECHHFNAYGEEYNFTDDSYLRLKNCTWVHSGIISSGRSISIENGYAQLSLCPFLFIGGTKAPTHDVFIRSLRLSNVFDGTNAGGGTAAAFAIAPSIKGVVDIDTLTVEVDTRSLSVMPVSLFTQFQYFGIHLSKTISAAYRHSAKNIHCEGYYKRITNYLSKAENESNFRDWGEPKAAPADTALITSSVASTVTDGSVTGTVVDGVLTDGKLTNTAVTGTATQSDVAASRSLGNRTTYYFRGCTMWGNFS